MERVRKQIKSIQFSLISPELIKKISAAKIVTPELYDIDGYPVDGGLMDLRLGAIDPGVRCRTCGGRLKECIGHPGSIDLARPVLHVKYVPIIEQFLRGFCKSCGKILLSEKDIEKLKPVQRLKKARDGKKCHYCNQPNEKVKLERPSTFMLGKKRIYPIEIREYLTKISDEEVKLVGINPKTCRPEWGVLTLLLVPPVTVRPSITLESGARSEDDITHKLSDITRANQRLWENLNAGAPEVIIEDLWDLLQYHVTTFFDNNLTRIPPARHRSGQPLKTITERIKGKEGRIRHNLAGKRVNYSARTVISPDPSIDINEVGVPFEIAKTLTTSESVTSLNIESLKALILAEDYPSANYIVRPDGKRKRITPDLKEEIISEISPGYIVERHLIDGDVVLFNRHPSLHRPSLMAHFVRVLPYKTFRLHPAATFPYNADFDGDEMNIHVPQTEEASAEAKVLLDVKRNLISSKNNSNLIGCISDAITGNYIISKSDLAKAEASQILFEAGIEANFLKEIVKGTEIFSKSLPKIDFALKTPTMDISIKQGEFLKGEVDKNTFGVEDGVLVKTIDAQYGRDEALNSISKVFSLGTKYLSRRGFTMSLNDLNVNDKVREAKDNIIKDAEKKTRNIIDHFYDGSLEIIPGKTLEETREIKILKILNETRTRIGGVISEESVEDNPAKIMIASGAGGNTLNITQIACFVGQQSLWNKRIELGYKNRTLSFFKENDLSPLSRGFIYSSYIKGLEPHEFFFGAITGRDGLMDTALRTPKSGYLYRRLANALQDLKVEYDGTIRDASGKIIQFVYGDDGLDVSTEHLNKKISPGEAIGIVTAQSFGEPSTQMTLNVFHFAGVQEMQITTGLPRLIEIFDARKKPSTPTMEIHLEKDKNNEKDARIMAEKIREVKLKDIVSEINVNFSDKKLNIILDSESVKSVHASPKTILDRISIKNLDIKEKGNSFIVDASKLNFKEIYKLKQKLKEEIVSGVGGIEQILVVKREKNFIILTSGTNLEEIMEIKGIDKVKTTTNDLNEIQSVLGIEAAREAIIREIKSVIEPQGLDISERHLKLVADAMCASGEIKGVTRMGIISQKSSILARASFETPIKQFITATTKGNKDELASVIENIILNQPVPIGTGLPGLLVKITGSLAAGGDKKIKRKTAKKKDK